MGQLVSSMLAACTGMQPAAAHGAGEGTDGSAGAGGGYRVQGTASAGGRDSSPAGTEGQQAAGSRQYLPSHAQTPSEAKVDQLKQARAAYDLLRTKTTRDSSKSARSGGSSRDHNHGLAYAAYHWWMR